MQILISYFRLSVFLIWVLIGIQLPAFVDHYEHTLLAHWSESQRSLMPFQQDADRHFSGDLAALIAHYQNNPDTIIQDGGVSLNKLYQRYQILSQHKTHFQQSAWSRYQYTLLTPLADIQRTAFQQYSYVVQLKLNTIGIGVSIALLATGLMEVSLRLLWSFGVFLYWGTKKNTASKKRKYYSSLNI